MGIFTGINDSSSFDFYRIHVQGTECLCLLKIHIEILTPNVMVFQGEVFGRWLNQEGWALLNGITALKKETPESFHPFPVKLQQKTA